VFRACLSLAKVSAHAFYLLLTPLFFEGLGSLILLFSASLLVFLVKMGNSFRPQPLPAIYPANPTPFAQDLLEVGILVAFGMIAFSFIVIIPGIRGWEVS